MPPFLSEKIAVYRNEVNASSETIRRHPEPSPCGGRENCASGEENRGRTFKLFPETAPDQPFALRGLLDWIPGVGRPRKAGLGDGVRRRGQNLRCDVHLTVILIVIKYSGRFLFMKKNRNNAFRNDSFFRKSLSKSGMMS